VPEDISDEERFFPEGRLLYHQHILRERNKTMVTKLKKLAMERNALKCCICGFDFYDKYGEIGKGFIECHHTVPVSSYKEQSKTKFSDLVLVCSNCHRMLHRKRPWLPLEELSALIKK